MENLLNVRLILLMFSEKSVLLISMEYDGSPQWMGMDDEMRSFYVISLAEICLFVCLLHLLPTKAAILLPPSESFLSFNE